VPHVVVVGGYAPYYPLYPYSYFGYPYYSYPYRPTKLDLKIEDIKNDYKEKIWAVKHNSSLTHKEKRAQVHQLKHDREAEILDTRLNFHNRNNDNNNKSNNDR